MAKVTINTIKGWFKKRMKPTQSQFWSTFDSFWHKDEKIPITSIENIEKILVEKADNEAFEEHLKDELAHAVLFEKKVDKHPNKDLSDENFTTELKQKLENIVNSVKSVNNVPPDETGNIQIELGVVFNLSTTESFLNKYFFDNEWFGIFIPVPDPTQTNHVFEHGLKIDKYIKIEEWSDVTGISPIVKKDIVLDESILETTTNQINITGYNFKANSYLYLEYTKGSGIDFDSIGLTEIK